jgi:uncharacterized membrane protein
MEYGPLKDAFIRGIRTDLVVFFLLRFTGHLSCLLWFSVSPPIMFTSWWYYMISEATLSFVIARSIDLISKKRINEKVLFRICIFFFGGVLMALSPVLRALMART